MITIRHIFAEFLPVLYPFIILLDARGIHLDKILPDNDTQMAATLSKFSQQFPSLVVTEEAFCVVEIVRSQSIHGLD